MVDTTLFMDRTSKDSVSAEEGLKVVRPAAQDGGFVCENHLLGQI